MRRDGWEWAERTNTSGVVCVVAETPAGDVLFVEQYRIPVQASVIEFPAGLAGDVDRDEALSTAAGRELLEETGWQAAHLERLTGGPVSAGMSSEQLTFFLATGLVRRGEGGGVDNERITVHSVPRSGAAAWLERRQAEGVLVDPKVYAGLYFLDRRC